MIVWNAAMFYRHIATVFSSFVSQWKYRSFFVCGIYNCQPIIHSSLYIWHRFLNDVLNFFFTIIIQLQCCGVDGYMDYQEIFNNFSVPVSCCNTTSPLANETTCPEIVSDVNDFENDVAIFSEVYMLYIIYSCMHLWILSFITYV